MAAKSGGKLRGQVFYQSLGVEHQLLQGAQAGSIDVGMISNGNAARYTNAYLVYDLPFLFKKYDDMLVQLASPLGREAIATFEKDTGLKALYVIGFGSGRDVQTRNKKLRVPGDIKGLKIRTISTPVELQAPLSALAERAAAYAMPGLTLDGGDAEAVYRATAEAIGRARAGQGPSFLELRVPRITPHSSQDDDAYRTEQQRREAAELDPLPRLRRQVLEREVLTESDERELVARIRTEVDAAAGRARQRPLPEPGRARKWLYAGDPPHPYQAELERGGRPAGRRG